MSHVDSAETKFSALMQDQIHNEFTAAQQYVAIAVYFDGEDLPQLAAHFYRQAVEERNHAMMLVRYLLDRDIRVEIPGSDAVRNDFGSVREAVALALDLERGVTEQIVALAGAARDERDYLGEQFMQWFLKEQVEEVASMGDLLNVCERSQDNLLLVEEYISREGFGEEGEDATAPPPAGGA